MFFFPTYAFLLPDVFGFSQETTRKGTSSCQKESVFDRLHQMTRLSDDVKNARFKQDEKTGYEQV